MGVIAATAVFATVAVKVMAWPSEAGFGAAATVVEVLSGLMVWRIGVVGSEALGVKSLVPL